MKTGNFALALLALFFAPLAFAAGDGDYRLGDRKEFWVWDLRVMPPAFRRTEATVRAVGPRSYIFVENALWEKNITPDYVERLHHRLEIETPRGALKQMGIIPLEEEVFAPLPKKIRNDERLIVLFADLGQYKDYQFDGFFNAFDQMKEETAWNEFEQHSNEANIIYINGFRGTEDYTTGVIAHELQHLLAHHATDNAADFNQAPWLSEMLAEGAMLVTGYYSDQGHVNRFTENPGRQPLVSETYVSYGPQLLFASYLIDSVRSDATALGFLTRLKKRGREAIEFLFRSQTSFPLNFDAIFSNFLTYVFQASGTQERLPSAWTHHGDNGLLVPAIRPVARIEKFPAQLTNSVFPYSFVSIDLAQEIPPSAVVEVEAVTRDVPSEQPAEPTCANTASVLWKPMGPKRIAVYAVGCEYLSPKDVVDFRLSIRTKPSLLPWSPLRLGL